ncbi:CRE-FOLT-1 protein, partial [Aphelenchoides avenae]
MNWKLTVVVICIYGVLKKLRPVTPFVTPFLESYHKNFTNEQIYQSMYPFWTYSYLVTLIPVSIAADLLKYKPILLLESLSLCAIYALLVFGTSMTLMQLVQVLYGIASSAEVSYNSYLYAVTDPRHFKQ